MKIFALTTALSLFGFQASLAVPAAPETDRPTETATSQLVLNITGYESEQGMILVALYADETAFDDEANPFRDATVEIAGAETRVSFEGLPAGDYAYKLFHDENGNGTLDTDGLGIPSETYFFSNDASDPFSAPEWGESKFTLSSGQTEQRVDLD